MFCLNLPKRTDSTNGRSSRLQDTILTFFETYLIIFLTALPKNVYFSPKNRELNENFAPKLGKFVFY